jgi:hypothetical protein
MRFELAEVSALQRAASAEPTTSEWTVCVAFPPNGDSAATGTLVHISKLRGLLRFSFQPFPGALLVAPR